MTTRYSEISFASVAPRYNQINALSAPAMASLGRSLAELLPPGAPALDMGCGAGRVAIPAARTGLPIVGLDLDLHMLAEAVRSTPGLPFTPVRGNVTRLPFAANSFNAVFSINVLHLVPDWQDALADAIRVLRPGGIFIQGRDWIAPDSCMSKLRWKVIETIMELEPGLRPTAAASPAVMAQALSAAGGTNEEDRIAATWHLELSPADLLDQIAARAHNETWMLSDDLLRAVHERIQAWVAETWSDPQARETIERRFVLTVTRGLK
jgi:SAM-dependent methyltransferase